MDQGDRVLENQEDDGVFLDTFGESFVECEEGVIDAELLVIKEGRAEGKGDSIVRALSGRR